MKTPSAVALFSGQTPKAQTIRKPMKRLKAALYCFFIFLATYGAKAQGTVNFNNRVTSGSGAQGPVNAPIYGFGQTLLAGTGFTVQLWGTGGITTDATTLQLAENGTTTFRTGAAAGYITALPNAAVIPNAPAGPGSRATLQLRAWDNHGGTITSWAAALASGYMTFGVSELFTPPYDLGGGSVLPPNLIGLTSFSFLIPEPSTLAMGFVGGIIIFLRLRQRSR